MERRPAQRWPFLPPPTVHSDLPRQACSTTSTELGLEQFHVSKPLAHVPLGVPAHQHHGETEELGAAAKKDTYAVQQQPRRRQHTEACKNDLVEGSGLAAQLQIGVLFGCAAGSCGGTHGVEWK